MVNVSLNEESIFSVACRIPADDARTEYLDQICGDDGDLRRRVQRLLDVYFQQPTFLENSHTELGLTCDFGAPERVGTSLGPYKIVEKIAEGGMGVVYVAEQKEPVRRKVALKVIRPGMAGKNVVARFEAERQALAMMNHPNIARVFDGGATDEQLPYFVMELVQGLPITEYCDQQRMNIRERLELFLDVCHAVQHAHQKGIIHRDLKPSNVLVAEIDAKAVAKVIDFGVAKAIHQPLTERSIHTQFSQMIGTPLYMSPEQASLGVIDVDTRSDVYSLGVMLYEMLTGDTPFSRQTLQTATFDEMRRIIHEQEPRRPSAMVGTMEGEAQSTIADQRSIDPRKLRDSLHGELDWIVMKALEKDRSRRYESASDLAADIERFLRNERVEACPPSTAYALRKFAHRNRGWMATVAAIMVALLVGTGFATWQAALAEAAAEQAEQKQVEAERNMKAAMDAVERLLANVSNPQLANVPGLQEAWVRILKESVDFYERFKADSGSSPEVDYRAAKVFLHFGHLMTDTKPDTQDVIRNYERGLELAEAIVLKEPKRIDFRELVAELHLACADYYYMPRPMATKAYDAKTEGHFRSAQQQYAQLALENPGRQEYVEMQGFVLSKMSIFFSKRSPDDPRIEELFRRSTELGRVSNVASALHASRIGDEKLAAQHWRNEVALYRSDPDNYLRADRKKNSGGNKLWWASELPAAFVAEYPGEAEWIWQESIKISYAILKDFPSHRGYRWSGDYTSRVYMTFLLQPERRDQSLSKLDELVESNHAFHDVRAKVLRHLGSTDEQRRFLDESLRRYPEQVEYYFERALFFRDQGDLEPALADLNQVLELDENHRHGYGERGRLLHQLGEHQKAIDDYTKQIPVGGGNVTWVYKYRATAYFESGQYDSALSDLNRAIDQAPKDFSPLTWIAPERIAACPDREFQAGLLKLADRALEVNEGSASALSARGLILSALGDKERAFADIDKALELEPNNGLLCNNIAWHFATHFGADPEMSKRAVALAEKAATLKPDAATWNTLGVARYRVEEFAGSIEALEKAEELSPGQNSAHNGLFLAMAHAKLGQTTESQRWYEKAVAWIDAHGADDELQRFRSEADELLEALDMLPPPSAERRMGQTGAEDTRADQPEAQPDRSTKPVLEPAGADPS